MALHSWELQKSIFSTLNGNATGMGGANVPVFDDVPEGTLYPYVVLGEETAVNNGTKNLDGVEHTLTIHAWSQYRGRREIKEIMQSVYENLHNTAISVTGASLVSIRQEFNTFRAVVFDN